MRVQLLVLAAIAVNYAASYELKCRVDDEVRILVDGNERANAFNTAGWQWTTVYTTSYTDSNCMLALQMYNQGGPGEAICTVDGQDISGADWRCKAYPDGQNPDTVYPGWKGCDFDDSSWSSNVLRPDSGKGNTAGMSSSAVWWWGAEQNVKSVVCRLRLNHQVKIRVDDEVRMLIDGDERANAFNTPGWQWTTVYTTSFKRDACMLAVQMYNQGGPGEAICTIDGRDTSGADWRCKAYPNGQNPDTVYPGWKGCNFDDSSWSSNVLRTNSGKGNTAGMSNSAVWWWGAAQNVKSVVCRLRLTQKLKIRVDDDVAAWADGENILDTFVIPGFQWRDVFNREMPYATRVLVIKVYNQGGPGEILCTINGADCSNMGWKCNDIQANQKPEEAYPGCTTAGFNDASWGNPVMRPNNSKGHTAGFDSSIVWWWGGAQSRRYAVCRLVL